MAKTTTSSQRAVAGGKDETKQRMAMTADTTQLGLPMQTHGGTAVAGGKDDTKQRMAMTADTTQLGIPMPTHGGPAVAGVGLALPRDGILGGRRGVKLNGDEIN